MGKGKGSIKFWISRVTAGKAIFQLNYVPNTKPRKALKLVKKILPIPTKIVNNSGLKRFVKYVL